MDNEKYSWRVFAVSAAGVRLEQNGLTWDEMKKLVKLVSPDCTEVSFKREGLLDG